MVDSAILVQQPNSQWAKLATDLVDGVHTIKVGDVIGFSDPLVGRITDEFLPGQWPALISGGIDIAAALESVAARMYDGTYATKIIEFPGGRFYTSREIDLTPYPGLSIYGAGTVESGGTTIEIASYTSVVLRTNTIVLEGIRFVQTLDRTGVPNTGWNGNTDAAVYPIDEADITVRNLVFDNFIVGLRMPVRAQSGTPPIASPVYSEWNVVEDVHVIDCWSGITCQFNQYTIFANVTGSIVQWIDDPGHLIYFNGAQYLDYFKKNLNLMFNDSIARPGDASNIKLRSLGNVVARRHILTQHSRGPETDASRNVIMGDIIGTDWTPSLTDVEQSMYASRYSEQSMLFDSIFELQSGENATYGLRLRDDSRYCVWDRVLVRNHKTAVSNWDMVTIPAISYDNTLQLITYQDGVAEYVGKVLGTRNLLHLEKHVTAQGSLIAEVGDSSGSVCEDSTLRIDTSTLYTADPITSDSIRVWPSVVRSGVEFHGRVHRGLPMSLADAITYYSSSVFEGVSIDTFDGWAGTPGPIYMKYGIAYRYDGVLASSVNVDAQKVFDAWGSALTAAQKYLITAVIEKMKIADLWDDYDAFWFQGTPDLQYATAAINWRDPGTYDLTFSGTNSISNAGVSGDTISGYTDTNFNPLIAVAPKFTQSDGHFSLVKTSSAAPGTPIAGAGGANGTTISVNPGGVAWGARVNQAATATFARTDTTGMYLASRTGASLMTGYFRGAAAGTDAVNVSVLPINDTLKFGLVDGVYTGARVAFGSVGKGLDSTKEAAQNTIVLEYLAAIGSYSP